MRGGGGGRSSSAVEETEEELQREIDELYRQQRHVRPSTLFLHFSSYLLERVITCKFFSYCCRLQSAFVILVDFEEEGYPPPPPPLLAISLLTVLVLVALFDRYSFFFLSFLSISFFTFCLYMKATSCFLSFG